VPATTNTTGKSRMGQTECTSGLLCFQKLEARKAVAGIGGGFCYLPPEIYCGDDRLSDAEENIGAASLLAGTCLATAGLCRAAHGSCHGIGPESMRTAAA